MFTWPVSQQAGALARCSGWTASKEQPLALGPAAVPAPGPTSLTTFFLLLSTLALIPPGGAL